MPRLSIVIPHRNHDPRLESSILSVLENRPEDSELIVVHDGSYADPYGLADELLFVQGDARANCLQLLNAGVLAACAPVVCTLLDGVTVSAGWAEEPLAAFESSDVAAVSVATRPSASSQPTAYGISSQALQSGGDLQRGRIDLEQETGSCGGPQLTCGFYRKRLLLSIGGWNDRLELSVADIDLAWVLQALQIPVACRPRTEVRAEAICKRTLSNGATKQLAELAVAYEATSGGATSAMGDLLRGCLSGHVSSAVSWATGVMSGRATESVRARLQLAREQLDWQAQPRLKIYPQVDELDAPKRRAA